MLIEFNNIFKTYGNGDAAVRALSGINFAIEKGEFVTIVGPSGSGKSTLLHVLGGMDTPDSGEVIFDNQKISSLSDNELTNVRLHSIGFIFQTFNLIPTLTALENIMIPMKLSGVKRKIARDRALELIDRVGLSNRKNHLPSQLSGGQKQRIAIARAIANNPLLILADEPTGNLDSASGESVMELLLELNNSGNTIVVVTHNFDIAMKADRQLLMKDGKLKEIDLNSDNQTAASVLLK